MRDENLRASLVVSGKVKEERKPRTVVSLTFPETTYNEASFQCAAARAALPPRPPTSSIGNKPRTDCEHVFLVGDMNHGMIAHLYFMSAEEFDGVWMVFYDVADCAYSVMSGAEWMKRDREVWLRRQMPTRVLLDTAGNEQEAMERLKAIFLQKQSEAIAA